MTNRRAAIVVLGSSVIALAVAKGVFARFSDERGEARHEQPARPSGARSDSTVPPAADSSATTLFESDWRTALGGSATALRDGRKWSASNNYGTTRLLEVVPAAGLGFPPGMANVLRVRQAGEVAAADVQLIDGIPAPKVGDHLYYRIYTRVDEAEQEGGQDHPLQPMPGSCPSLWAFKRNISSNGWTPNWQFAATPGDQWWNLRTQLQKRAVYRIEWHFFFEATDSFRFDTRIYDAADSLLYADADFQHGESRTATLASRDPEFRNSDNVCFRHLMVGNNGQANWAATNTYSYWGGVKVCRGDWCGAYP